MAEDVQVVFGARIDALLAGVRQSKEAIEGLRAPVNDFVSSLSGIGEAIGAAFAVEKLSEFSEKMAEVGEHATNMGIALGMSSEQFQQINEAMSLVGASGDALVRTERMLSRAAEEAIAQPLSHQADAFATLGINAKQFAETLRTDPITALKQLADAAVATGNTAITGPLGFLLGRGGGADLVAFFAAGSKGIDSMIAKVQELGAPSKSMLKDLDELALANHELAVSFENLGAAIASAISGPLAAFESWIARVLGSVTELLKKGHEGAPTGIPEVDIGSGEPSDLVGATEEEKRKLADIRQRENAGSYAGKNPTSTASGAYQMLDETWRRWAQAMGIDTNKYPTAQDAPNAMQDAAALYGLRTEGMRPWAASQAHSKLSSAELGGGASATLPDVEVKSPQQMRDSAAEKKDADDRLKEIDRATKARLAQLDFEKVAAQGNAYAIRAIEQQKIATAEEAEKRKQEVIGSTSGAVREALEKEHDGVVQGINLQKQAMQVDQQYSRQAIENVNRLLEIRIKGLSAQEQESLRQVDAAQRYGRMTAEQAETAEKQIVDAHQRAVDEILQQEQKNAQNIPQLEQRIAAQRVEIEQQTVLKLKAIDDKYQDEKLKKEHDVNQTISQDLNSALWSVATGHTSILQAFEKLGQQLGEAISGSLMKQLVNVINPGGMLGGLFGGSGGLAGIGALFGFSGGGIVPSAAGGWMVPSFQGGGVLSMLHGGEMVLPADLSQGMQGLIRNGGISGGTININTIDTQSGGQFLMRNRNMIGQAFRQSSLTGGLSYRQISNGRGNSSTF